MAATETPITELTPVYTDPAVLQGKAVLVHDPTTGDGIVFDASKLDPSSKYEKPETGIPETDLAAGVQESLEKADTALQPVETAIEDNLASFDADGKVKDSGIPSTKIAEIESEVQTLGNSAGVAEGIADTISAGTPQEFVFRQSGGDGVNYMKRIKGKTLVWNQLVQNGNFADSAGWNVSGGTLAVSNNVATVTASSSNVCQLYRSNYEMTNGHKFFLACSVKATTGHVFYFSAVPNTPDVNATGSWQRVSCIYSGGISPGYPRISTKQNAANDTFQCSFFVILDLTLMFGSGNEPTTVEEFEAMFPGYHSYSAGKLISNDASEIESVGRNVWDEEYTLTGLNDDGTPYTGKTYLTSKNYIPVKPNTTYYFRVGSGYNDLGMKIIQYDANKTKVGTNISKSAGQIPFSFTTDANCYYIKFNFNDRYGTTYNHDICINLSDESFNGQYEPYWKRTLQLNLNSIRVKSHNIWDEEWEEGVYNDNTGAKVPLSNRLRSKNFIPVSASTSYYIYVGISGAVCRILWYDNNKTFISSAPTTNAALTSPANASFMAFYIGGVDITTYGNDICINLSSSFNGQYEPHGILTFNGVPSAGRVYDEIVGNKYVKRVGSVDLGSLNYAKTALDGQDCFEVYCITFPQGLPKYGGYILSPIYSASNLLSVDKTVAVSRGSSVPAQYRMFFRNDAYSTADAFKTAMNGVMFNYVLATPIEYDLVDDIPNAILVDSFGTEKAIFPEHNDETPSAPFACDSNYSISVKNLVAKLNSINNS